MFDVTTGAYDGVEVCEPVGSFLFYALSLKFNKTNICLYRDDGFAVFRNVSGRHWEKIKKDFQKLFQQHVSKLIIKCNLKIVDFLDVTLNLTDSTYKPYYKPIDEICYIHKESNHPPSVTKQLPISVETRLSKLSSNEKVFNESVSIYQEALDKSGYNHKLTFQKTSTSNTQRRQRKRNIIWLNPPFSKSVVTKIGKTFLRLIDKHFPPHHKLHQLFNRNSVKISYSCMPNVKSIISKHNKTVLDPPINNSERTCNCINKEKCPFQEKCLTNNIMYKATLTSNQDNYQHKMYYGIAETRFKQRYTNHIKSFRHEKHQSNTELSNELWDIKNNNYTPNIVWEILQKHQTYNPNTKRCSLCLNEKLEIAKYKGRNLLNKRSEIINKCRH